MKFKSIFILLFLATCSLDYTYARLGKSEKEIWNSDNVLDALEVFLSFKKSN
jgi:hypothetical protein